jgi:membrane-bound inhibitor of C-type lysozyme
LDIFFTDSVHAKDAAWSLIEGHARFVFFEGDTVKENMKVASCKRQEIAVYVFWDRGTNRSVTTLTWKRQCTSGNKSGRSN